MADEKGQHYSHIAVTLSLITYTILITEKNPFCIYYSCQSSGIFAYSHLHNALNMGIVLVPFSEREYSTLGGTIALIITEHSYISPEGKASKGQLSISNDDILGGLSRLVERIHKNGAKVFAQISHAGGAANQLPDMSQSSDFLPMQHYGQKSPDLTGWKSILHMGICLINSIPLLQTTGRMSILFLRWRGEPTCIWKSLKLYEMP